MADSKLRIILQLIKKGRGDKETKKGVDDLNKSLTRMAKGAVAGFVAFKTLGKAWDLTVGNAIESEKAMAATLSVIEATGQAAGVTADEIDNYAEELQRLSGVDSEVIQGGQNLLLTFKEIKGEGGVFDRATRSMLDMAVAMNQGNLEGIDLKATSIQLGKALNVATGDTTAAGIALSALARVGVSFTDSQKEAAKEAVKLGNVLEFQNIILSELESEFGGAAEAAGNTLAGSIAKLELEIGDLGQTLGDQAIPFLTDATQLMNAMVGPTENAAQAFDDFRAAGDDTAAALIVITKGTQILEEAFISNRQKMLGMLEAGQLTVEQFQEYSQATFEAAQSGGAFAETNDLISAGFGTMTEELFTLIDLGKQMESTDRALIAARASLKNEVVEFIPTAGELAEAEKELTAAAKEQAAAEREVAQSLEAARQQAADTSIEFNNLAQSLVNATNADLAKVAIDGLDESLKAGVITRGDHADATRNVMLSFGLATDESIRLADSMGDVNQLFADGKLSSDQLVEVISTLEQTEGNLDQALGLLNISMGGINEVTGEAELSALALTTAQEGTTGSSEDLAVASEDLTEEFRLLNDRQLNVTESGDLVALSQGNMIGPVTVSGAAARAAAKDWLALATAMETVASGGGTVPLPGGAPSVPAFQHGGQLGRFGIVGDAGPELIAGNRVFDNSDTREIIGVLEAILAASRGGGNTFNVTTSAQPDVGQMVSQAQALAGAQ